MKILKVIDYSGWAIGALARNIIENNRHLKIKILEIHPKEYRANPQKYNEIFDNCIEQFKPDLIHYHYWDLAGNLKDRVKNIPQILTHHNQKNLNHYDWKPIKTLVCHTQKAKKELQNKHWNVEVIQHGIDINRYVFNNNYDIKNNMLGYIGRVVPWKGLPGITRVAKKLGLKVSCIGKIDKPDVLKQCHQDTMLINWNVSEDLKVETIHQFGIYIGNSIEGVEEGTLGLLEAMACGIPVITTPSGEANDIIKDGENGILVDFNNDESLEKGIKRMMKADRNKLRENAWNTVKDMTIEKMARLYEKLYYKTVYDKDLVSIIIPTANRSESIRSIIEGYLAQTYRPIEIIIVDDGQGDETKNVVDRIKEKTFVPIKYLRTNFDGYGLAMARNIGIFEATGNYLVFSDDRFLAHPMAVEMFVNKLKQMKDFSAVWGDKGAGKRDFIENFFAIRKKHIRLAGMFNERINEYGGQSQEIRERLRGLGFNLQFEPAAKCKAIFGTKSKSNKRDQIVRMKTKLFKLNN